MEFDEDLMIPDKSLSIAEGAITAMGWQSCTDKHSFSGAILDALAWASRKHSSAFDGSVPSSG